MKKLKIVGWFATILSILGIILNAYLIIWCWLIWIMSNIFWIYWALKKKEWAQIILWIVFLCSNIFGLWQWVK